MVRRELLRVRSIARGWRYASRPARPPRASPAPLRAAAPSCAGPRSEPPRQHRAGRAGPDDDVVVGCAVVHRHFPSQASSQACRRSRAAMCSAIVMIGRFVLARGHVRHDRAVDHAQIVHSENPAFGIDDAARIVAAPMRQVPVMCQVSLTVENSHSSTPVVLDVLDRQRQAACQSTPIRERIVLMPARPGAGRARRAAGRRRGAGQVALVGEKCSSISGIAEGSGRTTRSSPRENVCQRARRSRHKSSPASS